MVENHANWMSSPQSTFENYVLLSMQKVCSFLHGSEVESIFV